MYRGCYFHLFNGVAWSAYFTIYNSAKNRYKGYEEKHKELYKLWCAGEAAVMSHFITNPIWVTKTRVMLQKTEQSVLVESVEAVKKIWKIDGFLGFYRGFSASLVLSMNGMIQLYLYETFREKFPHTNLYFSIAGACSKVGSS